MWHHSMNLLKISETREKASAYKMVPLCHVHGAWGRSEAKRSFSSRLLTRVDPRGSDSGGCVVRSFSAACSVQNLQRMSPSALSVTWCHTDQNIGFSSQTFPFKGMHSCPILGREQLFFASAPCLFLEKEQSLCGGGWFPRAWLWACVRSGRLLCSLVVWLCFWP